MILYAEPEGAGLPSFDAESLAALSYLSIVAPDSFSVDRSINGSSLSTGHLPSLHDTSSDSWSATFDDIVIHLRQAGLDADDQLSPETRADAVAYSCMIVSKAQDLTALSLYADEENYSSFTRKELGARMSFPRNYIIPVSRHREALLRIQDLGFEGPAQNTPQGLFGSSKKAELRQQKRMIRIQSMADELYSVIETMLSKTQFLLGNKATSIDCLVFGHLALHLFPAVPNAFLATALKESYPRTWKYLVDFNTKVFDNNPLNIIPQPTFSASALLRSIWHEVVGHRPVTGKTDFDTPKQSEQAKREWRAKATFATGLAAVLIGFVLSNNLVVFDLGDAKGDDFMSSEAYNLATDDESESESDADELD